MTRRRRLGALRRRHGRAAAGSGESKRRFWVFLRGLKGPIPVWATSLEKAQRAAGAHAYAYRTEVLRVEEDK